jgi:hypothetical protein
MKPRHKIYLKINLMSLVFIVVSFISVTLAWFAYSGLANVDTVVDVKAWYIEFEKDGEKVSNNVVISLSEIYPGMETIHEVISLRNLGDSDAQVNYSLVSARILGKPEDNYEVNDSTVTSSYVEDKLSHYYPFHININLSKNYILSKSTDEYFEVSISWPLDSDTDALDSYWGTEAYKFGQKEKENKELDPNYQIRPSIQIVINVTAEQYVESDTSSDIRYDVGDVVLYDVENDRSCDKISPTCISTYVIDVNNKLGDNTVTLLPDPKNTYVTGTYNDYDTLMAGFISNWAADTRPLLVDDILKVISTDVMNSLLVRSGMSDSIIGNLKYGNRLSVEVNKAISYNGFYRFVNERFNYLSSVNCYWTSSQYNINNGFAIKKENENNSILYSESKENTCNIIPVIISKKL